MAGLPVRRAPYKDFLQPALQRRFASTATILLAVSYIEAVLLSQWNSFVWTWFPLGPAGIRAAFLFVCGLDLLILRIAHYHVGLRTTRSGFQTLKTNLASFSTYETAFWYFFSAFVFCPVFLWSMPESANLSWVTYFSGDRARANERPLFLASYLAYCALKQTIDHFLHDVDRLDMSILAQQTDKELTSPSLKKALWKLPAILAEAVQQALFAVIFSSMIYFPLIRSTAWGWSLTLLRPFYNLPRASMLPPTWPVDVSVLARCIMAGTLMFFIWRAGNTAFSIFMVREPLKNGQPLTSESKDPNGSLLSGLKSKKFSIQCFAMWELSHIAQGFDVRRQAIYADIDRKDGPMWSQVYGVCMDVIKSIETRVDAYGKAPVAAQSEPKAMEAKSTVSRLLRDDPIYNTADYQSIPGKIMKLIDEGAQSIGSGAHADGTSPLSKFSPLAKKTWRQTKNQVLSKGQQDAVSPEGIKGHVERLCHQLMFLSWFDALIRQDFRLELAGVVLGTPYAEPTFYTNTVNTVCQLAVHSLGEDQFGNVHRDVPSIIRTLTLVIRKVEDLKQRIPVHWTNLNRSKESAEVEQVLDALRKGLSQVVASFEPFCNDLRLTAGDLRLAKEASVKPEAPKPEAEKKEARLLFKDAGVKARTGVKENEKRGDREARRRAVRSELEDKESRRGDERGSRGTLSRMHEEKVEMEQVR